MSNYRIVISAGEQSGDQRAAELVQEMIKSGLKFSFKGMGGDNLRACGVDTIVDSVQSGSIMGIQEVFGSLSKIYKSWKSMKKLLLDWNPDLLILVDYPDFNLRIARIAKKNNIPVLYYIPPKVWAWRENRIKQLNRYCDSIASILPFEKDFYISHGCEKLKYVGHPFETDQDMLNRNHKLEFCTQNQLIPQEPIVAVFPGSRNSEIELNLPVISAAIQDLVKTNRQIQFVCSVPNDRIASKVLKYIQDSHKIRIIIGKPMEVLKYSDAGILKSGTCNLEACFLGLPFMVVYKLAFISEITGRLILKLKEFSLVNIICSGTTKEFIQENFTPQNIKNELQELLFNEKYRENQKMALRKVVEKFEKKRDFTTAGAAANCAEIALNILKEYDTQ